MKRVIARWMPALFFFFAVNSVQLGCSSSDEEGTEEEIAANGEENAADPNEEGQSNEVNENEEFVNNEAGNNNAGFNEGNNAAEDALAANGGGEEDLQQIIEEMNGANTNQLANQGGTQAFDNFGASNSAPLDQAPLEQAPVENLSGNIALTDGSSMPAGGAAMGMPAGPGLPELGSKMVYIVQKGDTLARIAQRVYGDGNKWTEIANFTGLANPKLIYPGDIVYYQLTEQSMSFAGAYEGMKRNEVQVSQGDTLATIAGRVLGNSTLWKLIWRQNDRIDNPDRLTAGTTLYYVDPAQVASFGVPEATEIVQKNSNSNSNDKPQAEAAASQVKVKKSVVFEVANDNIDDLFNRAVHKDVFQRSMI